MSKECKEAVVVAYGRSAVGKSGKKGVFRQLHPVELGGAVLKGVLEKVPQLKPEDIDDVIVGCAQQELKQTFNIARLASWAAGLPDSVPGMSCNRFCSSGLQSVALAAAQIESGMADVIIAGGIESMSMVPISAERTAEAIDKRIWKEKPGHYMAMGVTAENVAAKYGITREEMDAMAVKSHKRAAAAQEAGKFDDSIIPVEGIDTEGNPITVTKDQGIRPNTIRLSIGTEHIDDILADLEKGFAALRN